MKKKLNIRTKIISKEPEESAGRSMKFTKKKLGISRKRY